MPPFPFHIGFIGHCAHEPNREGLGWFLQHCWPLIRREVPGIRFRVVGKGREGVLRLLESAEGVDALGSLEDAADEVGGWAAMVIPTRLGTGTGLKVADAFSRKCPVVATRVAAFGYEVSHGRELFLADSAADFARACVSLVRHPAAARAMAARAHSTFLAQWTWEALAPRLPRRSAVRM